MLATLLTNTFIFSLSLLAYVSLVFVFAQIKKDNSVMDIAYGPLFFFSALTTLLFVGDTSEISFLITGLIGLWSLRLAMRISRKNKGKPEDARYAAWRAQWMKRGQLYFSIRSYLQINLLQGLIIVIVALPFIISTISSSKPLLFLHILGLCIFIFGLAYEAIADRQLDKFLQAKAAGDQTLGPIMQSGLFRFSRRPNYFGEILIWVGLFVIVLSLPFGFLAVFSPLLIGYIVTKVTGPMLENIFLAKYPQEYGQYMQTTSYIVPKGLWDEFRKKIKFN